MHILVRNAKNTACSEWSMSKFRILSCSNYESVASAGETPHFLVSWVVAILCRSQHMFLFSESRDALWVIAVNVGTVLEDLWLILCAEFINFMLEILSRAHDMCINCSNRSYSAIKAHYRFPAYLILPSHHVAAMFFILFGMWGGGSASLPEDWERYHKN